MLFHDPRREVEKLREHLGVRDGNLIFLMGAGVSCAAQGTDGCSLVPAVAEMGRLCERSVAELGSEEFDAYTVITDECEKKLKRAANVEDVLSRVRTKLAAMAEDDELAGASYRQLSKIEEAIRTTIALAAMSDEGRIPNELPHHALARWVSRLERACPVEFFTTNYDTLLERALEDERVAVFDGFAGSRRPYFSAASMTRPSSMPGTGWARLWKVHGSVNWSWGLFSGGTTSRIIRGAERPDGELIFPSLYKYDESRKQPYISMLDHLGRALERPEGTVLVVLGYSFGDEHINEIIFDTLDTHDRTHAIALQYEELGDDHELITRAARRRNLLVYGPDTAIVAGERKPWLLTDPVDSRTSELLDIPFDSYANPNPDELATGGQFRLGDFNYFARFLDSLAGEDD